VLIVNCVRHSRASDPAYLREGVNEESKREAKRREREREREKEREKKKG
jgi:hypothetical protein